MLVEEQLRQCDELQDRANQLYSLAKDQFKRHSETQSPVFVDRAIGFNSIALEVTLGDHPRRPHMLTDLGVYLLRRYDLTKGESETALSKSDIDRAIKSLEAAAEAMAPEYPGHFTCMTNLAMALMWRSEFVDTDEDADRAIGILQSAKTTRQVPLKRHTSWLVYLGAALYRRYQKKGWTADLTDSIWYIDMAIKNTLVNDPRHGGLSRALGVLHGKHAIQSRQKLEMNEAIQHLEDGYWTAAPLDPNRGLYIQDLANWLSERFKWTKSGFDLDRGIHLLTSSIDLTEGRVARARHLNNLSYLLILRSTRTSSSEDLDKAIDILDEARTHVPPETSDTGAIVENLGVSLNMRYRRTGVSEDIERAIVLGMAMINDMSYSRTDRARWLNNVSVHFGNRHERKRLANDLEQAIKYARAAVDILSEDSGAQAPWIVNLVGLLNMRFDTMGNVLEDLKECISWCRRGWECQMAPVSVRVRLARQLALCYESRSEWQESWTVLEAAIRLLPTVSPLAMQAINREVELADLAESPGMAAAAALDANKEARDALKALEFGRAIVTDLILEPHRSVLLLKRHSSRWAQELSCLRDELDPPLEPIRWIDTLPMVHPQTNRRLLDRERLKILLERTRQIGGFTNFLLPPSENDVQSLASRGPVVVVNVHHRRCDALLITRHRPIRVLGLPKLQKTSIEERRRSLQGSYPHELWLTLAGLWDAIASPVLDALNITQLPEQDDWPHVWWILTGQLSKFPIHAAGCHLQGSTDNVLDRAISSYSPSISALIRGRRHAKEKTCTYEIE